MQEVALRSDIGEGIGVEWGQHDSSRKNIPFFLIIWNTKMTLVPLTQNPKATCLFTKFIAWSRFTHFPLALVRLISAKVYAPV